MSAFRTAGSFVSGGNWRRTLNNSRLVQDCRLVKAVNGFISFSTWRSGWWRKRPRLSQPFSNVEHSTSSHSRCSERSLHKRWILLLDKVSCNTCNHLILVRSYGKTWLSFGHVDCFLDFDAVQIKYTGEQSSLKENKKLVHVSRLLSFISTWKNVP